MKTRAQRPQVIGFGNPMRGDDAIGIEVARRVRQAAGGAVEVRELVSDAMDLLAAWEDSGTTIVVDAMVAGAEPGAVRRFRAEELLSEGAITFPCPHGVGMPDAVRLAAAVGRLPKRLVVIGVEGSRFELGEGMSAAVEAAIEPAVEAVLSELNCRRVQPGESEAGREPPTTE